MYEEIYNYSFLYKWRMKTILMVDSMKEGKVLLVTHTEVVLEHTIWILNIKQIERIEETIIVIIFLQINYSCV